MLRRLMMLTVLAALGAAAVQVMPDVKRYLKMKAM